MDRRSDNGPVYDRYRPAAIRRPPPDAPAGGPATVIAADVDAAGAADGADAASGWGR